MVYEHESGIGEHNPETQLADFFEVLPGSALIKKSLRLTEEQEKTPNKKVASEIPKILESTPKAEGWDSLNEVKEAIVAKKNTISQNNIAIPNFENPPTPTSNNEKLNFSIETKKPCKTSQDLRPAPISAKSFTVSRNSIELPFIEVQESSESKERQESTANITYDHLKSVINEKRKENTETGIAAQKSPSNTTKSKNVIQFNRLHFQIVCCVLVLVYCIASLLVYRSNDPTILTRKGDALFVQSKFSESLPFYDQALNVDNRLIGPRLKRAQVYSFKGDYARALADAEHVLTLIPSDHQALKQCAQLNLKCKKNKRALECAQELLRLQYLEKKDLIVIIKVLAANHEHLRAIYFYDKYLQKDNDPILNEKVKSTIENSRKLVAKYTYQNGLNEFRRATISDPSRKIEYLHCMVEFAAMRKNYSDAENFCSEILAYDSSDTKAALEFAWFKYLLVSAKNGPKANSSHKYNQHLTDKLTALKLKVFEAFQEGDYNSVCDALVQSVQINPEDQDIRKFLTYTLMKANLIDKFTANLKTFENLRTLNLDELLTLMRNLYDSRQAKLASKIASYSISKNKNDAPAMLRIALECQKHGDSSNARLAALKGLNTFRNYPNQDSLYAGFQEILKK